MCNSEADILSKIEKVDKIRRPGKAERLKWLSLHEATRPPIMIGRSETFRLFSEAREVFLDGHYAATLLLGISYIEHTIIEELQLLNHLKSSESLSKAIQIAKDSKAFPIDWLNRAKKLSLRRNPFAHLKDCKHEHNLGVRVLKEKRSPDEILEDDAKDVIDLMNNFFVATLREMEM